MTGVVQSFHKNRRDDVDGLELKDGTEIDFPPHIGRQLTDIVAIDDPVTIVGRKQDPREHLHADKITNTDSGKSVVDLPPHEMILAEIRAIRALVDSSANRSDAVGPSDGPPHEQVLSELRDLRKAVTQRLGQDSK